MAYNKIGYASGGDWNVLKVNTDGALNVIGSVLATNLTSGSVLNTEVSLKDLATGSGLEVVDDGAIASAGGLSVVGKDSNGSAWIFRTDTTGKLELGASTLAALEDINITVGSVQLEASTAIVGSVKAVQSGTWNVGTVTTVSSLSAGSVQLQTGLANIGSVYVGKIATGTTNIGSVSIETMPNVTVSSLTAGSVQLQTGANTIGSVYTEFKPVGSVYTYTDENELVATWLASLSNVIDYGIAYSGAAGSSFAFVRTL
jgi:hypothetical protein